VALRADMLPREQPQKVVFGYFGMSSGNGAAQAGPSAKRPVASPRLQDIRII
jgi:hypothetical protein